VARCYWPVAFRLDHEYGPLDLKGIGHTILHRTPPLSDLFCTVGLRSN
jgi:hypothetical protein